MLKYVFILMACTLVISFGTFLFLIMTSKIIKRSLRSINKSAKQKHNRTSTLKELSQFIEFHSIVKQLSRLTSMFLKLFIIWSIFCSLVDDFSIFIQPILITLFLWSLVTLCNALLMIQIQMVHSFLGEVENSFQFISFILNYSNNL